MGKSKSKKNAMMNKKPKVNLTFDPKARVEYLSGFHKRKLERKACYKVKLEKRVAEEKQRIREKVKQTAGKVSSSHSILPEVEALLGLSERNPELTPTLINSFVLGSKVVTVSSLDDIHTKPPEISHTDSEEDEINKNVQEEIESTKSLSKKSANRMLQHSKAFKASQRLKQKSKKSRGQNRKNKSKHFAKKDAASETVASSRPQHTKRKGQPKIKKGKKL